MATAVAEPTTDVLADIQTLADFMQRLGDISLGRVLFRPRPGTATVADLAASKGCELIDGTLVEKAMGYRESGLAAYLIFLFQQFVLPRNLGYVTGEQGTVELMPNLVRVPDVAFTSWTRFPDGRVPAAPVPELVPDLAVEVLSRGNTPAEMARKRQEYFTAGVRLVWEIDPVARTVAVYTSPTQFATLTAAEKLDGGAVLPGFAVPLADLFAELDRHG